MLWGVGTGRCGTMTMAVALGGLHEPRPWIHEEATRYWRGDRSKELLDRLENKMMHKLRTELPIMDLKFSYIIPFIKRRIDPEAKFLWMIRNPHEFVRSAIAKNWYKRTEDNCKWVLWDLDRWRITPGGGFDDDCSQVFKCYWYWWATNRCIDFHIAETKSEFKVIFTHNMGNTICNSHTGTDEPPDVQYDLDANTRDFIRTEIEPYWKQLQEKHDGRDSVCNQEPYNVCGHLEWAIPYSPVP